MAAEYKLEGFQAQEEQRIARARLAESQSIALSRQPEGLQLYCKHPSSVTSSVKSSFMNVKYIF